LPGLVDIYLLNLAVTIGMFVVLVFRAWVGRILKAEKDLFCKIEGGNELYRLLCEIFKVKD
jgi:hypothetical protein